MTSATESGEVTTSKGCVHRLDAPGAGRKPGLSTNWFELAASDGQVPHHLAQAREALERAHLEHFVEQERGRFAVRAPWRLKNASRASKRRARFDAGAPATCHGNEARVPR